MLFVVADAHGNWQAIHGLLQQEGLVDDQCQLTDLGIETWLVQIGDLMNCVRDSRDDDITSLEYGLEIFDDLLVGNHEHPYWPGYVLKFSGFEYYPEIARLVETAIHQDKYKIAVAYAGVLITHAGVPRQWEDEFENDVEFVANKLNNEFKADPAHRYFNAIGPERGGWGRPGGVLWSDWMEAKSHRWNQIVGHSIGPDIRHRDYGNGKFSMCIDLGAKKKGSSIAGAWISENGTVTTTVYLPEEVVA